MKDLIGVTLPLTVKLLISDWTDYIKLKSAMFKNLNSQIKANNKIMAKCLVWTNKSSEFPKINELLKELMVNSA